MAKSKISQYNETIAAIRKSTGVSRKEAQQTYRAARVRLGHSPTPQDVKTKAVREEAKAAGRKIAAKAYAKERQLYKELERQRLPAKERKALRERQKAGGKVAPKDRGKHREPPGADRGGLGGPGGVVKGGREFEDYGDIEYEYDTIEYDTEGEY
jgi:hypothetical protein